MILKDMVLKARDLKILGLAGGLVLAGVAGADAAVVRSDLNLRAGPGTGYRVVATMPAGAAVDVLGCSGAWCRVAWGSTEGYASASYLGGGAPIYDAPLVYGGPVYAPPVIGWGGGYRHGPRHWNGGRYRSGPVGRGDANSGHAGRSGWSRSGHPALRPQQGSIFRSPADQRPARAPVVPNSPDASAPSGKSIFR